MIWSVGFTGTTAMAGCNTAPAHGPDALRGRMMSFYTLLLSGVSPSGLSGPVESLAR